MVRSRASIPVMRRLVIVLLAVLGLALAGCGDGASETVTGDEGAGAGSGARVDPMLTCGEGLPFRASALDGPTGAEEADTPEAEHLREVIAQRAGRPEEDGIAATGWRLLAKNRYGVTFGAGEPSSMSMATIWLEDGVWDNGPAGRCRLHRYREGYELADWKPHDVLALDRQELVLDVREAACASGEAPGDRLQPAEVVEDDASVTVTFWVKSQTGAQDCPGNPVTTVTVPLDQPLGTRELRDGGPWPAAPYLDDDPVPTSPPGGSSTTVVPPSTTETTIVEGDPPADRQAVEAEIDRAFHLAFDAGHTDEERFAVVEDGPALLPAGRAAAAKYPEAAKSITVTVHRIVFRDPTHAAVNFELFYERAMLLGPQDGEALLVDGRWLVSRDTRCRIIEQAGVACP